MFMKLDRLTELRKRNTRIDFGIFFSMNVVSFSSSSDSVVPCDTTSFLCVFIVDFLSFPGVVCIYCSLFVFFPPSVCTDKSQKACGRALKTSPANHRRERRT